MFPRAQAWSEKVINFFFPFSEIMEYAEKLDFQAYLQGFTCIIGLISYW